MKAADTGRGEGGQVSKGTLPGSETRCNFRGRPDNARIASYNAAPSANRELQKAMAGQRYGHGGTGVKKEERNELLLCICEKPE